MYSMVPVPASARAVDLPVMTGFAVLLMLVVGRRVLPKVLWWIAATGSRELFRLSEAEVKAGLLLHEPRPVSPRPRSSR